MSSYKEIVKALGSDPSLANAVMNAIHMRSGGTSPTIKFNCDVDDMKYIMLGDDFLVDKQRLSELIDQGRIKVFVEDAVSMILEQLEGEKTLQPGYVFPHYDDPENDERSDIETQSPYVVVTSEVWYPPPAPRQAEVRWEHKCFFDIDDDAFKRNRFLLEAVACCVGMDFCPDNSWEDRQRILTLYGGAFKTSRLTVLGRVLVSFEPFRRAFEAINPTVNKILEEIKEKKLSY
jgi:hypothetical protein